MKKILLFTTILLSIYGFGQKLTGKAPGVNIINQDLSIKNDTIINVVYKNEIDNNKKPAYFINGKLINEGVLRTINPNEIATINVEKNNIEIENVKYHEQLYIVTKSAYKPKLISLNNLKEKHIKLQGNNTIFKIDNVIVNADYNNFIVDENYILKIIVEPFENKTEKLNINFLNLITKSDENIKKSKDILIRGKGEFATNK